MEVPESNHILPYVRLFLRRQILREIPQESSLGQVLSAVRFRSALDPAAGGHTSIRNGGWGTLYSTRRTYGSAVSLVKVIEGGFTDVVGTSLSTQTLRACKAALDLLLTQNLIDEKRNFPNHHTQPAGVPGLYGRRTPVFAQDG